MLPTTYTHPIIMCIIQWWLKVTIINDLINNVACVGLAVTSMCIIDNLIAVYVLSCQRHISRDDVCR